MKIIFVSLVLGTFLAVSSKPLDNVHVLGTVEGKTFVNTNANLPWNAANAFCIRNGWSLAKITSNAQANFLKASFSPDQFDGWYWVGAQRIKKNSGSFMWTETGHRVSSLNSLGFSSWINEDADKNCLIYSANNHARGYYFRRACHHGHSTLCESSHPIARTYNIPHSREEWRNIGTFRGKTYFADKYMRSWTDSDAICKSKGLQLASVSSDSVQLQFFRESSKHINFHGWFWVANTPFQSLGRSRLGTGNCKGFDGRSGANFERDCLQLHFTLCESKNGAELETSVNYGGDSQEAVQENTENITKLDTLGLETTVNYGGFSQEPVQENRENTTELKTLELETTVNYGDDSQETSQAHSENITELNTLEQETTVNYGGDSQKSSQEHSENNTELTTLEQETTVNYGGDSQKSSQEHSENNTELTTLELETTVNYGGDSQETSQEHNENTTELNTLGLETSVNYGGDSQETSQEHIENIIELDTLGLETTVNYGGDSQETSQEHIENIIELGALGLETTVNFGGDSQETSQEHSENTTELDALELEASVNYGGDSHETSQEHSEYGTELELLEY
ncbi:unnamed protein product [Orchesella dallaii]|uniref:C-type lectin domain-containing protein n=1 Tax=Orchesella dallaii TaxID=48710 RepID=A0ABP1PIP1_9HEXA